MASSYPVPMQWRTIRPGDDRRHPASELAIGNGVLVRRRARGPVPVALAVAPAFPVAQRLTHHQFAAAASHLWIAPLLIVHRLRISGSGGGIATSYHMAASRIT